MSLLRLPTSRPLRPLWHRPPGSEAGDGRDAVDPGLGDSDEAPGLEAGRAPVDAPETGSRELGVTKDVFLWSHAQAGEAAICLTRADPQTVSGAVLVDATAFVKAGPDRIDLSGARAPFKMERAHHLGSICLVEPEGDPDAQQGAEASSWFTPDACGRQSPPTARCEGMLSLIGPTA
ncbi:hypothetical protein OV320_0767 [Actinobacteria bacterium OV320]|nr:hypothetical protein OV320_0767 [Actinobacteria bacterium OV320]